MSKHVEELPENYEWFQDQIAGHHPTVYRNGKREIGILKKQGSDKVLKLIQDGNRGICEKSVYRFIKGDKGDDPSDEATNPQLFWKEASEEDRQALATFAPDYHGSKRLTVDGEGNDLTMLYKLPAILDVKMGLVCYDPTANEDKIKKTNAKYPPGQITGFRLLGYRIHRENSVDIREKPWGQAFDERNIADGLKEFFEVGRPGDSSAIKKRAIELVEGVLNFFNQQTSFHFYASSLLFLYETDPSLPIDLRVYMIDFSHVFPGNGKKDQNYLPGLHKLINSLKKIV